MVKLKISKNLICTICLLSIILGTSSPIFSIVAFGISVLFLLIGEERDVFSFMFFLIPFANIFKWSPTSSSFFTFLQLALTLILLFRKRGIKKSFLILWITFVAICFAGSGGDILLVVKQGVIPLFVYLCLTNKQFNIISITKNYAFGLLISSIMALCSGYLGGLDQYLRMVKAYELSGDYYRFTGLYADPNFYSVAIIVVVMGLILLIQNNKIKPRWYLMCGILAWLGTRTISKSFLLMLAVVCMFFCVILFKKRKYGMLMIAIFAGIIAVGYVLAGNVDLLQPILERLLNGGDISTGRFAIWKMYFEEFGSRFHLFLLGHGIGASYLNGRATHNTIIEFLYHYGVVGSIFFLILIKNAFSNKLSRNIINYMPLMCFFAMCMALNYLLIFDFAFLICYTLAYAKREEN